MSILIIICLISVPLNILLIWYIKKVLQKLLYISENMSDLLGTLSNFSKHLQDLHEMEMYYGDQTLKDLITHSRTVVKYINEYKSIYTLLEDEDTKESDFAEEA
tara:strand:+ start:1388 stop:1699 length:312 start_codon:yes stop_codon:yes gene_type:complete